MKSKCRFSNLIPALFLLLILWSCGRPNGTDAQGTIQSSTLPLYTCPMPEDSFFSNKAGDCPKCGMELIPVHETDTLSYLLQPTNQLVISKLKPIVPTINKQINSITAEGYLTYDPEKASSISARVSGRIDKLYIRTDFQKVQKGEKLLDLYSPELQTTQNELLYLLKSKEPADIILTNALHAKLRHLGMEESAIEQLRKNGKAAPIVTLYATLSGHVHFLKGATDFSSHAVTSSTGSNNMEEVLKENENNRLQEGGYVTSGDLLFTIVDQSGIWALFKLKPKDIGLIRKNDKVEMTVNKNIYHGKVSFTEKSFDDFYTIRVPLAWKDHHQLKIGALVKGIISGTTTGTKSIWIPAQATVYLGKSRSAVFLRKGLGYMATEVSTGAQVGNWIEVTSGLSHNDSIAPVASYLVDSESFISTAK